ncbi:hypothetical protein DSCA_14230 [Desulfosarcina alkanivorans]|jgi:hypothetical protein|uniref:DUF4124 domain-containing protein n=1 Tax=Desulfosarcina alkanivorans TaxID=571177 RepID=A0A5K7YFZ1_9BACT|nr:DUF4124 domain-containing protein [Desulfosarcina alkanivorans]BBO67493.1 hypothetical protein DSCA_14230 [Desulfosarcina alkanivorans]
MWKWTRNLLLAGVVVWLATPVFGEYYRYTDQNGVLRFTDDLSGVPPDQRPRVETYESTQSHPLPGETAGNRKKIDTSGSVAPPENTARSFAGTWQEEISLKKEELDRMQTVLNKDYTALQNERTRLQAAAPKKGATSEETEAYRQKVAALNVKIVQYEEQLSEYTKKVESFNAQYQK